MEGVLDKLKPVVTLKIPRFVGNVNVSESYELLVFYDASMKAYTTAIYFCIEKQNAFCVNLAFSKMRRFLRVLVRKAKERYNAAMFSITCCNYRNLNC